MATKSVKNRKSTDEWKGIRLPERTYDGKLCYYYQPAESGVRITAIFENPTHLEYLAKRPVVGETGVNLHRLLNYLTILDSSLSKVYQGQLDKLKICIVNATNIYGDVDGLSTEAKYHLVVNNSPTLIKAVEGKTLFLVFGETADMAYDMLSDTGWVNGVFAISVYHLSPRALRCLNGEKIHQYLSGKKSALLEDGDTNQISLALKLIADYITDAYGCCVNKHGEGVRVPYGCFSTFAEDFRVKSLKRESEVS